MTTNYNIRSILSVTILLALLGSCASINSSQETTIYRDSWGSPYIYSDNIADAYYALGHSYAEDKGEAYLQTVLIGIGELAKYRGNVMTIFGAPAIALDSDAKRWRHASDALTTFEGLDSVTKSVLNSFADGFNSYYSNNPTAKPEWAPSIEGWHALAAVRGLMWQFSVSAVGKAECRAGGASVASINELDKVASRLASNQWMLAGSKTADGSTVHLTDPHGPVDGGMFMSEYNINADGLAANVFGMGPIPITAATTNIAWGFTTGGPDIADCYSVELSPEDSNQYFIDGVAHNLVEETSIIEVADGENIDTTFQYTMHNGVMSPVVGRDENQIFVVSTPYMGVGGVGSVQLLKLLNAKNIADVEDILSEPEIFTQNMLITDRNGDGLFIHNGRTPKRPDGYDWSLPVDGNTNATSWLGIHSLSEMVTARLGDRGYLKNTNEAPKYVVAENSPIQEEDYPSYLYTDPGFIGARAFRLGDLLGNGYNLDIDQIHDIVFDEYLPHTPRWQSALNQAINSNTANSNLDEKQLQFAQSILNFDGIMDANSVSAANYYSWRRNLASKLSSQEMRTIYGPDDPNGVVGDLTEEVLADLIKGIVETSAQLTESFGDSDITLGRIFKIGRGDVAAPLGGSSVCGLPGRWCEETLRAYNAYGPMNADGYYTPQYGSRMIRLTVFGDETKVSTAFNFGQSNNPSSEHFSDQAAGLFSPKRLKIVYFNLESLLPNAASEEIIKRQ